MILRQLHTSNYFLLAHLSSYGENISIGKIIAPGEVVAKVGNTGGDWPFHLHISYYNYTNEDLKNLSMPAIYKKLEPNQILYLRNPINHKGKKDGNKSIKE